MLLDYELRVRDLVHGTILFTDLEKRVIHHPLFQRLRNIKQNDVTGEVYPSANTSRFEHVLGVGHVAGLMAEHLTTGPNWTEFANSLKEKDYLDPKSLGKEITTFEANQQFAKKFVCLCRIYALLHDIGHLPLSHLFEDAFSRFAADLTTPGGETNETKKAYVELAEDWFGESGFGKLHEAFGAYIINHIIDDANVNLPSYIIDPLKRLMTEKTIDRRDPLSIVKQLVDAEIDADRIDFVRRDGLLAGGEYGNYDIGRLCRVATIIPQADYWILAYSDKAITSIEALLFDRYRVYQWVHFHHRAIVMKALVIELITDALKKEKITKEAFTNPDPEELSQRDDVWLWGVLRSISADGDSNLKLIQRAVFLHERRNVLTLWKRRPEYRAWHDALKGKLGCDFKLKDPAGYAEFLSQQLDVKVLSYPIEFTPVDGSAIRLFDEQARAPRAETRFLSPISPLLEYLETVWDGEPQHFVILVGDNIDRNRENWREKWTEATLAYVDREDES